MIYVIISPLKTGKLYEMQRLMAAVETLADAFRRIAEGDIADSCVEELTEDEEKHYVRHCESSCGLPSLPKHQIPWYTSGYQ